MPSPKQKNREDKVWREGYLAGVASGIIQGKKLCKEEIISALGIYDYFEQKL